MRNLEEDLEFFDGDPVLEHKALFEIAIEATNLALRIREFVNVAGHPGLKRPLTGLASRLKTLPGMISKFFPFLRDDMLLIKTLLEVEKGRHENERVIGMMTDGDQLHVIRMKKGEPSVIRSLVNESQNKGTDNKGQDKELSESRGRKERDRGLGGQLPESRPASTDSDRQGEEVGSGDEESGSGKAEPRPWLQGV